MVYYLKESVCFGFFYYKCFTFALLFLYSLHVKPFCLFNIFSVLCFFVVVFKDWIIQRFRSLVFSYRLLILNNVFEIFRIFEVFGVASRVTHYAFFVVFWIYIFSESFSRGLGSVCIFGIYVLKRLVHWTTLTLAETTVIVRYSFLLLFEPFFLHQTGNTTFLLLGNVKSVPYFELVQPPLACNEVTTLTELDCFVLNHACC